MKGKVYAVGIVLVLSALALGGCATTAAQETGEIGMPNPASVYCEEQGGTLEVRTGDDGGQYGVCVFADGSECEEWAFFRGECSPGTRDAEQEAAEVPEGVLAARDAALDLIFERYGAMGFPPPGADWTVEQPSGELVGYSEFRFSAADVVVTVGYPITAPDATVYEISVTSPDFQWEGEADAAGQVIETSGPVGELSAVAWYGFVISTPEGAQFDDYLVLAPEGTAEVGIEGATQEIEAQILALRDQEDPGRHAHFWGTLLCQVPDYGGCQLRVTRLRVDGPGPFFEPDPVDGWQGTIVSGPAGPRSGGDDYLVLASDLAIQYGIDSTDPQIEAQLADLRDTGTVVRVWGEVSAGVIDWNATQIHVTRIEVVR